MAPRCHCFAVNGRESIGSNRDQGGFIAARWARGLTQPVRSKNRLWHNQSATQSVRNTISPQHNQSATQPDRNTTSPQHSQFAPKPVCNKTGPHRKQFATQPVRREIDSKKTDSHWSVTLVYVVLLRRCSSGDAPILLIHEMDGVDLSV